MTIQLNIFVAGPVNLSEQREMVRAIVTEINSEYSEYGHQINPVVKSFEDIGNLQEDYNKYIENEANLVFFILKDAMASGTELEYRIAAEEYNKHKKPIFSLFLKRYETKTPEIEHLEEVMKTPKQAYYTLYSDKADLRVKIKDQIEKYVNKCIANNVFRDFEKSKNAINKKENEIAEYKKKISKFKQTINNHRILTILLSALALALVGYSLFRSFASKPKPVSEPMLVFAGGGSVVNFIDNLSTDEDTVDILNYPNSVYVNMPSGNAWTLLVEDTYKDGRKNFYPVCLSADEISGDFVSSNSRRGHIIGIKLGNDPLIVYLDSLSAGQWGYAIGRDTTISVKELSKRIDDNRKSMKARLFTTASNSGTLRAYQDAVKNTDFDSMLEKDESSVFFYTSKKSYINEVIKANKTQLPYVILGSQYYFVKDLEDQNLTRLFVVNENDSIYKPLYVYFSVTSKVENQYDRWRIEPQIIDFLKAINANYKNDIKQWDNIVNDGSVVIDDPNEFIITLNDQ